MPSQISERELLDRVRELAEASKGWTPSADVEARLMRAFADGRTARTPRQVYWPLAVAAAVALVALTPILMLPSKPVPTGVIAPADPPANGAASVLDGFVPVPGTASLPQLESARIVRYQVPVAALPAYGVELVPESARRAVEADLLIGQDGYPRAIRLIPDSRSRP